MPDLRPADIFSYSLGGRAAGTVDSKGFSLTAQGDFGSFTDVKALIAKPAFAQAAMTAMERCALYLFRYLDYTTEERLSDALRYTRDFLKLVPPKYPILNCRDWPKDEKAGAILEELLKRFEQLEDGQ